MYYFSNLSLCPNFLHKFEKEKFKKSTRRKHLVYMRGKYKNQKIPITSLTSGIQNLFL